MFRKECILSDIPKLHLFFQSIWLILSFRLTDSHLSVPVSAQVSHHFNTRYAVQVIFYLCAERHNLPYTNIYSVIAQLSPLGAIPLRRP